MELEFFTFFAADFTIEFRLFASPVRRPSVFPESTRCRADRPPVRRRAPIRFSVSRSWREQAPFSATLLIGAGIGDMQTAPRRNPAPSRRSASAGSSASECAARPAGPRRREAGQAPRYRAVPPSRAQACDARGPNDTGESLPRLGSRLAPDLPVDAAPRLRISRSLFRVAWPGTTAVTGVRRGEPGWRHGANWGIGRAWPGPDLRWT